MLPQFELPSPKLADNICEAWVIVFCSRCWLKGRDGVEICRGIREFINICRPQVEKAVQPSLLSLGQPETVKFVTCTLRPDWVAAGSTLSGNGPFQPFSLNISSTQIVPKQP